MRPDSGNNRQPLGRGQATHDQIGVALRILRDLGPDGRDVLQRFR